MSILKLNELCANRRAFVLFILVSALIFQAVVLLFPSPPFFVLLICVVVFAGEWVDAVRARLDAIGLRSSQWLPGVYGLFVNLVCLVPLYYFFAIGRFIVPAFFFVLHLPLMIRNNAIVEQRRAPIPGPPLN